jgi:hypothetical protein
MRTLPRKIGFCIVLTGETDSFHSLANPQSSPVGPLFSSATSEFSSGGPQFPSAVPRYKSAAPEFAAAAQSGPDASSSEVHPAASTVPASPALDAVTERRAAAALRQATTTHYAPTAADIFAATAAAVAAAHATHDRVVSTAAAAAAAEVAAAVVEAGASDVDEMFGIERSGNFPQYDIFKNPLDHRIMTMQLQWQELILAENIRIEARIARDDAIMRAAEQGMAALKTKLAKIEEDGLV